MIFDQHTNFPYSTVLVAPVTASAGTTLTVQSGEGADFPPVPFNAVVWPVASIPRKTNATIIRVTNIAGDVLTFTRQAEGSNNRSILVGDQIGANITLKMISDLENNRAFGMFS